MAYDRELVERHKRKLHITTTTRNVNGPVVVKLSSQTGPRSMAQTLEYMRAVEFAQQIDKDQPGGFKPYMRHAR